MNKLWISTLTAFCLSPLTLAITSANAEDTVIVDESTAVPAELSARGFYLGETTEAAWDQLVIEVIEQQAVLDQLIAEAKTHQVTTKYAEQSKTIAEETLKFAIWDHENTDAVHQIYAAKPAFIQAAQREIESEGVTNSNPAEFVPFQELVDSKKVLVNAINEIQKQINGDIELTAPVNLRVEGPVDLVNGNYQIDGKVVYPSNIWGMTTKTSLIEAVGSLGSTIYSPAYTEWPGTVRASFADGQARRTDRNFKNKQIVQQVHLTHTNIPYWMTANYPGIDKGRRAFVHYDIDHPAVEAITAEMVGSFVPKIKAAAGDNQLVHVIINEPHWDIKEGAYGADGGVSEHTMDKYQEYLATKYGTIENLNAVYSAAAGQTFTSFEEVRNTFTIPLSESFRGTAIWYDWCRLNMNRVNDFATNLRDEVRKNDATSPISIKLFGRQLQEDFRDDGIDLEYLYSIQDMIGADNMMTPLETPERNTRFYQNWKERYTYDWREEAITLDFAKSLYPKKPFFDSEWRGISSNAWLNMQLDRDYVRNTLWMGFTNGLGMVNAWWWTRRDSGELKANAVEGIVGTILTQPVAFDTYAKTIKEVNAHGNLISKFAAQNRDFLIFYSEDAAIQDTNYPSNMADIYEAAKMLNLNVGFTTTSKIADLSYAPKGIIIPPSTFISDESVAALAAYKTANPSVKVVNISKQGEKNFVRNELGLTVTHDMSFVDQNGHFTDNFTILRNRLNATVRDVTPRQLIPFNIKDPVTNKRAYGVHVSQTTDDNGVPVSLFINLSQASRKLTFLEGSKPEFTDIITNQAMATKTHTLAPYEVLFIKATEAVQTPLAP